VDIQIQSNSKEYGKLYKCVNELRTVYNSKIYKLAGKTGRTSVEMNEAMEEVRNYFQRLTRENAIVIEGKDSMISNERDQEI
jgi:hypothetical protein